MSYLKLPLQLDLYSKKKVTNVLPQKIESTDLRLISRNQDHYYLQFNFKETLSLPHQGFKIHISCSWHAYKNVLNKIFDFCKENKITFKYISNKEEILKNLSGKVSLWSAGKFITIYPSNIIEFKSIINKLYNFSELKNESGIYVLTDRRYKDSNNIFYRYGIITKTDEYIYDLTGKKLYKDYEELEYKLPNFIEEPFPINSDTYKKEKYIYKKYLPKKGLKSKSSGSVFEAMCNNKPVVLKNAKYGYEDGSNTEIEKLKNEEKFLKKLKKLEFIPNFIDSFYEDKDYFLVEELIDGIDGDSFRALPRHSFNNPNVDKNILYKTYSLVIINILKNILTLHKNGIFLGDISSSNILINLSTNETYFIDLGQSTSLKNRKTKGVYRTSGFYDSSISSLSLQNQDKKQLGYLMMSLFSRANMFLKIDFSGYMSINFFKKFAEVNNIPSIFVKITEELITNPKIKIQDIIDILYKTPYIEREEKVNLAFPYSLLQSLSTTCLTSKIDKIKFNKTKLNKQDSQDFLTSKKYMVMEMDILEKGYCDKQTFTNTCIHQMLLDLQRLNNIVKTNDPSIHNLNLGKILSMLFCVVDVASCSLINKKYINDVEAALDFINQNYQVKQNGNISYRISYSSIYMSPYLSDGIAGVLNLCLVLKEKFGVIKYDNLAFKLAHELMTHKMPKNASFNRGLAGIVFVLMHYRQLYGDVSIDKHIKEMVACFDWYTYNWNGNKYIVDTTFSQATINFEDGNKGVIKALRSALELYNTK